MNLIIASLPYILLFVLFVIVAWLFLQSHRKAQSIKQLKTAAERYEHAAEEKAGFIDLMARFFLMQTSLIDHAADALDEQNEALNAATNSFADTVTALLTRQALGQQLAAPAASPSSPPKQKWMIGQVWLPIILLGVVIIASNAWLVMNSGMVSALSAVTQASFFAALSIGLYIIVRLQHAYKDDYAIARQRYDKQVAQSATMNERIGQAATALTERFAPLTQAGEQLPDGEPKQFITLGYSGLEQLLKRLQHVSTITPPTATAPFSSFRFSVLLAQAQSTVSEKAQAKQVGIVPANFDDVTLKSQQSSWVVEILASVLDNAIRYSQPGERIEVSGFVRDEDGYIKVTDSGPGLPSSKLAELFQPFAHARAPIPTVAGLGFSFFFDRLLIGALGGEVHIESSATHGTTVTIRFPQQ